MGSIFIIIHDFSGLSCTVSMRLDLSMAIVCMVNSTAINEQNSEILVSQWTNESSRLDDGCPVHKTANSMKSAGYNVSVPIIK